MDTAVRQKFPNILNRNFSESQLTANCKGNLVCTSCDIVVLGLMVYNVNAWFGASHDT